jgi:hypothetical protein
MMIAAFPRIYTAVLVFLLSAATAPAAALTLKELEFLLRQGTPESEIVQQVISRRLAAPLDAAAIASLKAKGASGSLIARLKAPGIALDPNEAATEARRQAATKARLDAVLAEDTARQIARNRQWNENAERLAEAKTVQGWLHNKLYTLQKKDLVVFENRAIAPISVFGFFHGAMKSGPSRDFAPRLAEAYTRLKKQYPTDFEIVFISHDRDEYNQKEFLRTFGLTCPTMRVSEVDPAMLQLGGEMLPWFVVATDNGKALSRNGVNKQFIEPMEVLLGLEQILAAMHR